MIRLDAVLAMYTDLDSVELYSWIERRWVQPEPATPADGHWIFHEIDIARVRLIHDLRHDLDTPEDTIPMVLSLLDQVYDLRGLMKTMLLAVRDQPPAVQSAVFDALRAAGQKVPDGL